MQRTYDPYFCSLNAMMQLQFPLYFIIFSFQQSKNINQQAKKRENSLNHALQNGKESVSVVIVKTIVLRIQQALFCKEYIFTNEDIKTNSMRI